MINADGNKGIKRGIKYCKCKLPLIAEGDKPTFHNCYKCNRIINKEVWEEEFEDKLDCILKISNLIKKYLGWYNKVKIKAKDGKIVIKRII